MNCANNFYVTLTLNNVEASEGWRADHSHLLHRKLVHALIYIINFIVNLQFKGQFRCKVVYTSTILACVCSFSNDSITEMRAR